MAEYTQSNNAKVDLAILTYTYYVYKFHGPTLLTLVAHFSVVMKSLVPTYNLNNTLYRVSHFANWTFLGW